MSKPQDVQDMDTAYIDLIKRYRLTPEDEPYLIFGALALEQDKLVSKMMEMEAKMARMEQQLKPKLIVPARAI